MTLRLWVRMCITDVPIPGCQIDHQGELLFVLSMKLMYTWAFEHGNRDMRHGANLQSNAYVTMKCDCPDLWMSHDRGCWGLILQCYECMSMHMLLRCWCSIQCLPALVKILSVILSASLPNLLKMSASHLSHLWIPCRNSTRIFVLAFLDKRVMIKNSMQSSFATEGIFVWPQLTKLLS